MFPLELAGVLDHEVTGYPEVGVAVLAAADPVPAVQRGSVFLVEHVLESKTDPVSTLRVEVVGAGQVEDRVVAVLLPRSDGSVVDVPDVLPQGGDPVASVRVPVADLDLGVALGDFVDLLVASVGGGVGPGSAEPGVPAGVDAEVEAIGDETVADVPTTND